MAGHPVQQGELGEVPSDPWGAWLMNTSTIHIKCAIDRPTLHGFDWDEGNTTKNQEKQPPCWKRLKSRQTKREAPYQSLIKMTLAEQFHAGS
jgi:hypothetical protein